MVITKRLSARHHNIESKDVPGFSSLDKEVIEFITILVKGFNV
jgi:hypothetical protein